MYKGHLILINFRRFASEYNGMQSSIEMEILGRYRVSSRELPGYRQLDKRSLSKLKKTLRT